MKVVAILVVAAGLLAAGPVAAQPQSVTQRLCVDGLGKSGEGVAKAQGKEITACLKPASQASTVLDDCIAADAKGKVKKAADKTVLRELVSCDPNALPDFAVPQLSGPYDRPSSPAAYDPEVHDIFAEVVNPATVQGQTVLATDLLGNPTHDAVLIFGAPGAACQAKLLKTVYACDGARRKAFGKCVATAVGLGVDSAAELASLCTTTSGNPATSFPDPGGKLAKKCEGKLASTLASGVCAGVSAATLLPGVCAASPDAPGCVVERLDCRLCQQANATHGLGRQCDLMDDGVPNLSCRDALPVCGDDILDLPSEQCDDANTEDGDCCSATCQLESTLDGCAAPVVTITSPAHGIFTEASQVAVTGFVSGVNLNDAAFSVNGVPVTLAPDKTFSTTVNLVAADVFNPVLAELTRLQDGKVFRDRVVVIAGDSIAEGDPSPDGVGLRIAEAGLNQLEPAVTDLVDIDLATLLPPGTLVIDNFCYATLFGGCIGRVDVTISGDPAPSIGGFEIDIDPMNDFVAADVTISNLAISADVDDATGVPLSCTIDIEAATATVLGDYALEPFASMPSKVDVTQVGGVSLLLGGFSDDTNCGGLLGGLVELLIDLFIGDIEDLITPAVEDFLNTVDGNGNTPIAGALETALAGVDIGGAVGGGLGVELDVPFTLIQEQGDPNPGITFAADATATTADPDPAAPELVASYHVEGAFPPFGPTTPVAGLPYGLGLSLSASTLNQLLRAQIESGLLRNDIAEIDIGFGPLPVTAGLVEGLIPEFDALPSDTPLVIRLAPTLAPVVTGSAGPGGELAELRIGHLRVDVVQVGAGPGGSDVSWLGIAADAVAGLDVGVADGALSLGLGSVSADDITVALLQNPLGVTNATIDTFIPLVLTLLLPQLDGSLGEIQLPVFLGLELAPVEVSRTGAYLSIFANLAPAP